MSFHPDIMSHDGVRFTTTNNSYEDCLRTIGSEGLEELFVNKIHRKRKGGHDPWITSRGNRGPKLPTCEQAEVLYPDQISLEHLTKIYVENAEHFDVARGWANEFGFESVTVEVNEAKFMGRPN